MIVKTIGALIFAMSLWVLYSFEQSAASSGFQLFFWPAIFLTFFGPCGLLLMSCDSDQIQSAFEFLVRESLGRSRRCVEEEYVLLRTLSSEFYVRGSKAFDLQNAAISPYLSKTLERLAIRIPLVDAYDLLERERDQLAARIDQAQALASLGGRIAPSIGMLGTIIGMSQLLSHLKEPDSLGSSMSVALLTTFYGLFFSLAIWTPIQHHLARLLEVKMQSFDQGLHWLELLQKRKPANYFGEDDSKPAKSSAKAESLTSSAQSLAAEALS